MDLVNGSRWENLLEGRVLFLNKFFDHCVPREVIQKLPGLA
jgi:hypothetical protein